MTKLETVNLILFYRTSRLLSFKSHCTFFLFFHFFIFECNVFDSKTLPKKYSPSTFDTVVKWLTNPGQIVFCTLSYLNVNFVIDYSNPINKIFTTILATAVKWFNNITQRKLFATVCIKENKLPLNI